MEKYELIDARSNRKLYLEIFDEYYRELLEEDPTLNEYSSKECALENLDSTTDSPYFIMVNNSLAGLVVFSIEEENVNDDECHSYLNEIYVKKEYRNKGIATSIAINYFNSLKYDSGLCYLRKSKNEQFWKKTIKNYHFSYKIYKKNSIRDFMHIYIRKRYLEKTNMSSSLVKLVKYYPNYKTSFGWYQDLELCKQVDNIDTVYDLNRLKRMYKYLNKNGKLYYIKYKGRLVGDICLENNGYVAIVVSKPYQNMHIGSVAINEIKKIAKDNNMQEIKATIYSFNKQSQKMFLNNGFEKVTEEDYIYKIRMI